MKKLFFIVIIFVMFMFDCVHTATNTAMRIDTVSHDENNEVFNYTMYNVDDLDLVRVEDLAVILNGTDNNFDVKYEGNSYVIQKNTPYTGEKTQVSDSNVIRPFYKSGNTEFNVDGELKEITEYQIEGANFFDINALLDVIGVRFDNTTEDGTYIIKNTDDRDVAFMVMAPTYKAESIIKSKYRELEYNIDPTKPMIALTFDDGPKIGNTERIVEALKQNDSRATFFVVGQMVEKHPELVKLAYDAGCQIGNHSYSHANLVKLSADGVKGQVNKTSNLVYEITGEYTKAGRPPYGSINDTVRNNINMPWYNWNIDTLDWKNRNADYVKDYVLKNVKDGDVVLMHDLHSTTADAMVQCIPELTKRGFQLVTIDELVKYKYNSDVTQVPGYVK